MTTERRLFAARVRVPCSTSNLGAGYDTLGLALDRYLDVTFLPDDEGELRLERSGTLARLDDENSPDLVAATLTARLEPEGGTPSGLLQMHSEAPVARGMGNS